MVIPYVPLAFAEVNSASAEPGVTYVPPDVAITKTKIKVACLHLIKYSIKLSTFKAEYTLSKIYVKFS